MRDHWSLIERGSGRLIVERLVLADGFWLRLVGWQFRARPTADRGLLLVPCRSIHTCWLRFAIDVLFLDNTGAVIGYRDGVRPWRIVLAPRATHAVLELPAGTPHAEVGDSITVRSQPPDADKTVPKSLRFLTLGPGAPAPAPSQHPEG